MKRKDLEKELRKLKFTHLTESELIAYCDEEGDQIHRARVEAHLKRCFICERQLKLLREESALLRNRQITDEDIAFVDQMIERAQKSSAAEPLELEKEPLLQERLAEYFRQLAKSWRASFLKKTTRITTDQGEEIWQWQSKDGRLQVRATMEKKAGLTIHFSSNEIDLDGARLNIHLGKMDQEITLQRVSESEVYAKVAVPRRGDIADISIKSVKI
jgi:hypothetical protein